MPLRRTLACALLLASPGCSSDPAPASTGDAGSEDAPAEGATPAAPYSLTLLDSVRIESDPASPTFQNARAPWNLHDGPFERVHLVVTLATTCFPFEAWTRPPPGERWPADCDAFDRNFELSLEDPSEAAPGLEIERAITPFGGPMELSLDVTDVANAHPMDRVFRVHVATWSDAAGQVSGSRGGWTVSARVEVTPGAAPRRVLGVLPLHYDSQTEAVLPPLSFDVPPSTTRTRLELRATGHGGVQFAEGCGLSPAEEFCLRTLRVDLDGARLDTLQPWREDCASLCTLATYSSGASTFEYCRENPCGAVASVRAPRANWCPGSVTPPYRYEPPDLGPGRHQLSWAFDGLADGGSWRMSAVLFAYGD